MTPRPVLALLALGAVVTAIGSWLVWRAVSGYLDHPLAPSSTSGNRVFILPDGTLGAYPPFALGFEPVVAGVGIVLLVGGASVAAATYRRPAA